MIEITLRDLISALADEGLALVEARPHAYGPANVMPAARLHSALTRRTTDPRHGRHPGCLTTLYPAP